MSGYCLTLRKSPTERVDLSLLTPVRLATLSAAEVGLFPLRFESATEVPLGDLFDVAVTSDDSLRFVGDLANADHIGRDLASGTITIDGTAGRGLGRGMTGGRIEVRGNAGDGTGLEMAGGSILVHGSTGRDTGGAAPGAKRGMTGGEIIVSGDAGDATGACLRRGLIAVAGNAGVDTARAAIAGTVLIGGDAAGHVGLWSKRATVIALGAAGIPPTYQLACTYRPGFVWTLLTHLQRTYRFPTPRDAYDGFYHRYSGDFAESGQGEILQLARD